MTNQLASLFVIAPVHGTSAALLTNMLHEPLWQARNLYNNKDGA